MRVWFNKTFSSVHKALKLIQLGDTAKRYELFASNVTSRSLVKLYAHQYFQEPKEIDGNEYVDWCLQFCQTHNINIFVPGKATSEIVAAKEKFIAQGTRLVCVTSPEYLVQINNKAEFYQIVDCPSAPAPDTKIFTSLAEFDLAYEELSKKHRSLCIKPSVSVYGIGFRRIRTDLTALQLFQRGGSHQIDLTSLRTMLGNEETFPRLLLMEFLSGPEYSVDCLADNGVLKCAVARCKPLGKNPGQQIEIREDIEDACQRIISQFKLNAYVNIQFRQGENGLSILEVNPRLSGGIGMTYFSGVNLPYLGLLGFDHGYENITIPPIQAGVYVTESNQEVILT